MSEGRAALRQVEEARIVENEKWLAFYDAQSAAERAKFRVLRETGGFGGVFGVRGGVLNVSLLLKPEFRALILPEHC